MSGLDRSLLGHDKKRRAGRLRNNVDEACLLARAPGWLVGQIVVGTHRPRGTHHLGWSVGRSVVVITTMMMMMMMMMMVMMMMMMITMMIDDSS